MIVSIDDDLFKIFPSLRIGILVCEINNTRYGDDQLEEVLEDTKVHFSFERPEDHPHIKAWREAFIKLNIPATEYFSSVERLLKQALRGGPFPRDNPLIDLYHAISLKYLVPIGCHALSMIEGNICLCFAEGTESFVPLNLGEAEIVEKGEVIYRDDKDALSRRWVWMQSHKSKIESETTHALISFDIMEGLPAWICDAVMKDLEENILQNEYGKMLHRSVLTKENTSTEFNY